MILRPREFKDDLEEDVFINGLGGRSLKLIAQLVYLADQEAQNRIRACCFRSRYFPGGHDVLVNKE
ncbi:unnamed protein product [Schistosoma intercalatum]|nr:unnamed protein product [Schistosoma intercalatum]